MTHSFKPIDIRKLKTYSISERKSKVSADDFAIPWSKGGSFKEFLEDSPVYWRELISGM